MPDSFSAKYPLLVSREQVGNAVRKFLRLHVGQGRRYSVKELGEATGVPPRRIECAMCDPAKQACDFRPLAHEHIASLALFFGPDFSNAWMPLIRQGAFSLPDGEPAPGDLAADAVDDAAAIARAARHGQFNDSDRKALSVVGAHMMREGAELIALQAHESGARAA
jgi:hypothetical protein